MTGADRTKRTGVTNRTGKSSRKRRNRPGARWKVRAENAVATAESKRLKRSRRSEAEEAEAKRPKRSGGGKETLVRFRGAHAASALSQQEISGTVKRL